MTAQDTTDEETPLLQQEGENHPKKRTAIPWAQVSLLLVLQLSEPLTSQVIYPFAPEVCFHFRYNHFHSALTVSPAFSL